MIDGGVGIAILAVRAKIIMDRIKRRRMRREQREQQEQQQFYNQQVSHYPPHMQASTVPPPWSTHMQDSCDFCNNNGPAQFPHLAYPAPYPYNQPPPLATSSNSYRQNGRASFDPRSLLHPRLRRLSCLGSEAS